jgi:protein-tyrosine phosphatase
MTAILKRKTSSPLAMLLYWAAMAVPAPALENARIERSEPDQLTIKWTSKTAVDIYVTNNPAAPVSAATRVSARDHDGVHVHTAAASSRSYFLLRDPKTKKVIKIAERLFPLEQGSNFRDIGGYTGANGKAIKWGKIFRSGALPLLSERDYALLSGLKIKSIIDLRSLDEREVAATELDDHTGALFISNDYSLKPLMRNFSAQNGENVYVGLEKMLKPQYRAIFTRLLAADGAVMYHCSAGQDRTGIASALVLSALGVDCETILKDYHLSTASRRPQWEMPKLDPAEYPDNPIVQYYATAAKKPGGAAAEPLYSKSGQSHLVQFFAYLDKEYGGVEGYLAKESKIGAKDIARLQALYLAS